jgi:hypothetical protein
MMTAPLKDFGELKREVLRLLDQSTPATETSGADTLSLTVKGQVVTLCHFPSVREDRVFVVCDCGELSEDEELRVLRRLFEANFAMYRGNAATFARDPFNGHIVLLGEFSFAEATAEYVIETVKRYGDTVGEFKRDRFLGDEHTPPALPVFHGQLA